MSPNCGCTCPHAPSYAPMTAQDLAVTNLMLFAFLLMLPALVGIHFWVQARLFPQKMLVLPKSLEQPVFLFRRRGLSRIGAALTLPFLFNILAIVGWSCPSFSHWDSVLLWLLWAYPAGTYSLYGVYTVLKHLGRDEFQLDVAHGVFYHRIGLPGLERTRTGKISLLGQLEVKEINTASSGHRDYWVVRFKQRASREANIFKTTLLGGFDNQRDAERMYDQLRFSLENRRIVFPLSTPTKEGGLFVYSRAEQSLLLPDVSVSTELQDSLPRVSPDVVVR